jgi:pyruvate,water dikinase
VNPTAIPPRYIRWFEEVGIKDIPLVGGKNASLGELYRELAPRGIKVPNGFAITADAYWELLRSANLFNHIKELLSGLDAHDTTELSRRGSAIRHAVSGASLPEELQREILAAYHQLSEGAQGLVDVAVRSSATAEDLPDASFAGQQETYLNVQGDAALLESCKRCFASLFTDRAISYRQDKGFDHLKVGLSIGIQRMVRSDLAKNRRHQRIQTRLRHRWRQDGEECSGPCR